ncbi:type I restriction endonuclease subunit R [Candidatus Cloacimonadota bacterium]
MQYTEHSSSHVPALQLLKKMGYNYISPESCLEQRGSHYRVILKETLYKKLSELNSYEYKGQKHKFSQGNIEQAIKDLDEPLKSGLVKTNEQIYDYLMLGRSYPETLPDGSRRSFDLKYIDWENIENNVFHITEEFSVERSNGEYARPDIVLFVNGIPFAVIECKKPSITVDEAVSQSIRNQKKEWIPQLFKFVQIVLATNRNEAKYATCGTDKKFWSVWKDRDSNNKEKDSKWLTQKLNEYIVDRDPTNQDKHIISLLSKERLLEFTRFFVLYDKNVKKIARHQQYSAVKALMNTITISSSSGNRQGGIIWHTQGSGKSITMIMFAKAILANREINDPKVIVVTDRINLDKQIRDTFSHTRLSPARAKSGNHLISLIKDENKSIITTLIHKFALASSKKVINQSQNIFVLIDESHRSQYNLLHNNMKEVLPSACYIGFTGTPLMKSDLKNTMIKFGSNKPVHQYTILDGVEDGTILPLLYEGKMVDQTVNKAAIDKRLDIITRNLTKPQKTEVMQKWSRFEKIASSSQRINLIAYDINEHFTKNFKVENSQFKAMLATYSKAEAISYYRAFEDIGELNTAVIISPPDQREGHESTTRESKQKVQLFWLEMMEKYNSAEEYESYLKEEFVNGDNIDLIIVVDKLLTGFDAPRATVLYIDKPMKEHTLLQAIARVNRLFDGKDYGHIIDYRGLLVELDQALETYSGEALNDFDQADIQGAMYDVRKVIGDLKQAHAQLWDFFKPLKRNDDIEKLELKLEDDKTRSEFYDISSIYGRNVGIALASEAIYFEMGRDNIIFHKKELRFFQELRRSVKLRYSDGIDHKEYEAKMQNLMDNYIAAEDVIRITNPVDILDEEGFEKEMERLQSPRARADAIRTRLTKSITKKMNENPAYFKKFSERIKEILEKYKESRINEAEYLSNMKEILKDYRTGKSNISYPECIQGNENAQAFYGILNEMLNSKELVPAKDAIAVLANDIESIIQHNVKVDWKDNPEVHKKISQEIDDLLFDFSSRHKLNLEINQIDKIIENLKTIAMRRY